MKKFVRSHPYLLLGCVFVLALVIRLYRLESLPANMHEDEILTGYVGRFIWLNGRDLYNNPWPLLYFNKFGDYYIILPMYLKGLATFIFGVNAFAVRFPSAFLGALAVVPVYQLAQRIFSNKKIALLSAFLLAISPWDIVMSRASSEGVMGSTILLFAIVCMLTYIHHRRTRHLVYSLTLFFISYFIYHPFRILTPLALLPLPFLFPDVRRHKKVFMSVIISTILFSMLTAYISTTPWGSGRFAQTSIFSGLSGVSIKIQEFIYDEGTAHTILARIFHNKAIGYGREFIIQYLTYFSPRYLFTEGGLSLAYRVPEQGLFFISFLLLALLSLIPAQRDLQERIHPPTGLYAIYLLLISVVPSAMTVLDAPNVHRSIFMSLLIVIVFGYGFYRAFSLKWKGISLAAVVMIAILVEFTYFWHQYSAHADYFNALNRNDAQREVVQYLSSHTTVDQPIIMPVQKTMPLYYLFYTNDFNPRYATEFALDARIDHIKNVKFMDEDCPSRKLDPRTLPENAILVDSHNCQRNELLYDEVTRIQGRNELLGMYILKPVKNPLIAVPVNKPQ